MDNSPVELKRYFLTFVMLIESRFSKGKIVAEITPSVKIPIHSVMEEIEDKSASIYF